MRPALPACAIVIAALVAGCGGGTGGGLPSGSLSLPGSTGAPTTTEGTVSAPATTEDATTEETTTEDAATEEEATTAEAVTVTETVTETAPTTTAEEPPPPDAVADKRLARDALVQRKDLPDGGFKGLSPPGDPSRCFTSPARKLRPYSSAEGRQYVGNRSRSVAASLAWVFADKSTAADALAAVSDSSAVECFAKANARGLRGLARFVGATKLDYPKVGDQTRASRAEFSLQGARAYADYLFVRTGRVLTVAAFGNTGSPAKETTTQAVLEQVVERVRDAD
jgi:hypothetical protein